MASEWLNRWRHAPMPWQNWNAFPPEAIVQVKNVYGDSKIGPAKDFWWGFEINNPEGVILKARRLDKPKQGLGECVSSSQTKEQSLPS